METFNCVPNVPKSKLRPNLTNNFYHNVPRTMRPVGSEYAIPNYTGRRSVSSLNHTLPWQERPPPTPVSCIGMEHKSSRGKLCSIALAIASFVVLVAVLAVAGLALYMGVLHTETPNALLTFSCSAKVLRGDRFVGALPEKARRYKRQFELLYQRSILGKAFISCAVDKFGNDTVTIYYKLAFNRMKLTRNVSNIEKAIKDILLTDAISRNSVFKNVRFDPKHISVRQILSNEIPQQPSPVSSSHVVPTDSRKVVVTTKPSVVLRPSNKTTTSHAHIPKKPIVIDDLENIKEEDLPVIQGSFKISKTDADITEKKTEQSTSKPKISEKTTTSSVKKSTFKESSVTSALYKIAAVEKVTKQPGTSTTKQSTSVSPTTLKISTTSSTPKVEMTPVVTSSSPVFVVNPFDEAPWIPILPNMSPVTERSSQILSNQYFFNPTYPPISGDQPTYTSFTNPGLSLNFNEAEKLGSTSLKSHPIPVNKIPSTEPSVSPPVQNDERLDDSVSKTPTSSVEQPNFVEIKTFEYVPNRKKDVEHRKEEMLKNISSIFHTLAASLDNPSVNFSSNDFSSSEASPKEEQFSGQGQVEVVVDDVDELMLHTTRNPLVTLLPVKSNSGIGRPFRKRPFKSGEDNFSTENRSFPSHPFYANSNSASSVIETKNNNKPDFQIMGVLNFIPEKSVESNQDAQSDIVRYPKMDLDLSLKEPLNDGESFVFVTNSSESTMNNSNILTMEEIKKLSEISKIIDNSTVFEKEPTISNKAISSSHSTSLNGIQIMTKPFNKINLSESGSYLNLNVSDCTNSSVICGDGKCLPETTKCNQLIDCNDGKDEQNCNCADHLKSQFLIGKICDGVVDCWDYSDE
nr:cell wall protein DAN4 [Leptinotarsa decemlineata]